MIHISLVSLCIYLCLVVSLSLCVSLSVFYLISSFLFSHPQTRHCNRARLCAPPNCIRRTSRSETAPYCHTRKGRQERERPRKKSSQSSLSVFFSVCLLIYLSTLFAVRFWLFSHIDFFFSSARDGLSRLSLLPVRCCPHAWQR